MRTVREVAGSPHPVRRPLRNQSATLTVAGSHNCKRDWVPTCNFVSFLSLRSEPLSRLQSPSRQIATFARILLTALLATGCSATAQAAITFDSQGNVYIGTSALSAGQQITPGAFQPTFRATTCSGAGPDFAPMFFPCSHGYVSKVS